MTKQGCKSLHSRRWNQQIFYELNDLSINTIIFFQTTTLLIDFITADLPVSMPHTLTDKHTQFNDDSVNLSKWTYNYI